MADKTISNLTAADQLYLSDLFAIDQNGTAKKLSGDVLKTFVETYSGGGGGGGGTTDYPALSNKPQINGTTLTGNKTAANLGLAAASHSHSTSDITGLENYVNGLIDVKLGVIEDAYY